MKWRRQEIKLQTIYSPPSMQQHKNLCDNFMTLVEFYEKKKKISLWKFRWFFFLLSLDWKFDTFLMTTHDFVIKSRFKRAIELMGNYCSWKKNFVCGIINHVSLSLTLKWSLSFYLIIFIYQNKKKISKIIFYFFFASRGTSKKWRQWKMVENFMR